MTWQTLVNSVRDYVATDVSDERIEEAIGFVEARVNRLMDDINLETRARAVADSEYIALPNDFRRMRAVRVINGEYAHRLVYVADETIETAIAGLPQLFSIVDGQLRLAPAPDTPYDIEMVYFVGVQPLTMTNVTNWLQTEHPDLYHAGVLSYIYTYEQEPQMAATFKGVFDEVFAQVKKHAVRRKVGSGAKMRPSVDENLHRPLNRYFGYG